MTADNRDPFALARQGEDDAELFALIDEFRQREAFANERDIDDEERARRCAEATAVLDRIDEIRPGR